MRKLPILLAVLIFSQAVFAQFGAPGQNRNDFGPEPGNGFEQGFGFDFGEAFNPGASDIAGGGANLVSLKIYNKLVKAIYKTQSQFKEACIQDGGEESLVAQLKEIYQNNQSEITEICSRYEERSANFSEEICDISKGFSNFPAPKNIKEVAQELGVTVGFNMTASDMERVCLAMAKKEMSKQLEFMDKRFIEEAKRFLDGCKQREDFEEKMKQQDEQRRQQEEEFRKQREQQYNQYNPFGQEQPQNYGPRPFEPFGPNQQGPPEHSQPFCGDGICNEDSRTCVPDCGAPPEPPPSDTAPPEQPPQEPPPSDSAPPADNSGGTISPLGEIAKANGTISFQEPNQQEPQQPVFGFPGGNFPQGSDSFGPGFDNGFGPPSGFGPDMPQGFNDQRGFGQSGQQGFDNRGPNFGPGNDQFNRPDFGQNGGSFGNEGFGPQGPFEGPNSGPGFGPQGFGQDSGPFSSGQGFGPPQGGHGFEGGPGFGPGPLSDADCESTPEQMAEKIKDFSGSSGPTDEMIAPMCKRMAVQTSDQLFEFRERAEAEKELCEIQVARKKNELLEATQACKDASQPATAENLIRKLVKNKCTLERLKLQRQQQMEKAFETALGLLDIAEKTGNSAIEATALSITEEENRFKDSEKQNVDFFSNIFGSSKHAEETQSAAATLEERKQDIEDLIESGALGRSGSDALEEELENLDQDIERKKQIAQSHKDGLFGRIGAIFGGIG